MCGLENSKNVNRLSGGGWWLLFFETDKQPTSTNKCHFSPTASRMPSIMLIGGVCCGARTENSQDERGCLHPFRRPRNNYSLFAPLDRLMQAITIIQIHRGKPPPPPPSKQSLQKSPSRTTEASLVLLPASC